MARGKMLAARLIVAAAWLAIGASTLAIVYAGSAEAAHMGRWIEWR